MTISVKNGIGKAGHYSQNKRLVRFVIMGLRALNLLEVINVGPGHFRPKAANPGFMLI